LPIFSMTGIWFTMIIIISIRASVISQRFWLSMWRVPKIQNYNSVKPFQFLRKTCL
jgi:hypothetical protein